MKDSPSANNMPAMIGPALLPICSTTCGVKYKPSDVPMTHCPALRAGLGQAVRKPAMRVAAVTSSAPSIHGNGIWAHTATSAPANASTRPAATRHPTLPPFIPSTHMLIGKPDYELVGYLRKLSSPYRVHYCVNHDPIQTARRRHHHLHRDEPVGHRAQGHQPRPGLSRFRSRPGAVRVGIQGHGRRPQSIPLHARRRAAA